MSGAGTPGDCGYGGPWGLFPVPYGKGVFGFHWFQFYNAICFQIILGAPIVLLAKDLGANSVILGVIASFTPLMTVLQLPAARHLGRCSYRSFALMGWSLRSVFIAIAAFVPLLLFWPKETRLWILLGSLFFFNLLRGISSAAFLPWISSLADSSVRGRFISIDHSFVNAGSLVTMLVSALLMRGDAEPWQYSLVLWVSVAGAAASLLYLRHIPDGRDATAAESSSDRVPLAEMFRLPQFRNWNAFNILFVMVAGGLAVFPVEYLKVQAHFTPSLIYGLSAFTFLGPLLILQRVGVHVDRHGSTALIRAAVLSFAVVLAVWFAMSSGLLTPTWWLVMVLNLLGGAAMAAFNMANGHLMLTVVPDSGKNHYFAVAAVIVSLAGGLSPLLWGWLLDSLGGLDLAAGPFHLRRHSVYFLSITILSLVSLAVSRILIDPDRRRGGEP